MTLTNEDIITLRTIITEALVPVTSRLNGLEARLERVETKLNGLETNLRVIDMKLRNSTNGRNDKLSKVPKADGSLPSCEYPGSINNLIVSGNELLPGGVEKNNWNKAKSLNLILEYEPDYKSDAEGSDSEDSSRSRKRRLKVAKLIGITSAQLNFAQLSL